MKNFTAIIVLFLLAATTSAQNKIREMANETYVNRAKTTGVQKDGDMPTGTKNDGVLVGDRKGGGKQTGKDGVLIGDRSGNAAKDEDGETQGVGGDTHSTGGDTHSGNKDGVLVGDKRPGKKLDAGKDGVLISDREGDMPAGTKKGGEVGSNNRDGVLISDRTKDGNMGNGTKKDGVLVGDRSGDGNQENDGKEDGETNHGNRDGVLVGDKQNTSVKKEDIMVSGREGVKTSDKQQRDGETGQNTDDNGEDGETGQNNKDGVLVGDKTLPVKAGVYPNPTSGQATIQAPAGTTITRAQVFNAQGRQQMMVNGNKNQNLSINLGALNPGTYIFRIQLSNGVSQTVSIIRK